MTIDVTLFRDLEAVGLDAADALARQAQPCLFDRLDWFRLVRDDLPKAELLVISARNGVGRCWLFLAIEGRNASSLNNGYALRFGPVVDAPTAAAAPLPGLVRGLREARISRLFLSPISQNDPLCRELRRSGWLIRQSPINVSWRIHTQDMSFDQYWAGRPSRLRQTAARRARQAKLDIRILDGFDEQAMADYEAVYEASWKPPEGAPGLIRRLALQEGKAGTLRLGLAYHQGRAVAAQLWLVENGVATIHKLAYCEEARKLSAGTVLSVEMFRRALDVDKVAMIDFGIGDHSYKADWMTHSVPLYALSAYDMLRPAGVAGLAQSIGSKLASRLRRREA